MALVSTRIDDGIAVIVIDNPPVSTGNAALRTALHAEFLALVDRPDLRAVVLRSAQAHFYSGSDIKEFDGDIVRPSLPEIIELISDLPIPVVAALNGSTLGGGLELALACDCRIAAKDSRLGLPEVTLGMLPGAGGTVRLPRLVGLATAIEIIGSGRPVGAQEALAAGLVDAVVDPADLPAVALDAAKNAVKRRAEDLTPPPADPAEVEAASTRVTRGGRARPNVVRAIDLARSGLDLAPDAALAAERAVFNELRVSAEARNLRYLFFAKRDAARDLAVGGRHKISTIGIVGAGTMGRAIASRALAAGLAVTLVEADPGVLARATESLAPGTGPTTGTLTTAAELSALAGSDVVIEAVYEDMTVKQDLLRRLEAVVGNDTTLASNTSYLDLNEMAQVLDRPERFVGVHFFMPADRNPLLEVVRTATTGDQAVGVAAGLVRAFRKTPILAGVGEGFVANRVYADYRAQAEFLVEDGAAPEQVDAAVTRLGLPIGPFAVADMSGLDIAWARRKRLAPTRDARRRYVGIADTLCESNRLGRKTGAGWYDYSTNATRGAADPAVAKIIAAARDAKGITARPISDEEIQRRIVCAMVVAAAEVIANGVARRASDVDVALTEGFAFPAYLGGPLRFAAAQAAEWLARGLAEVRDSDPAVYGEIIVDGAPSPTIAAALAAVRG